jgi:glycine oxidase
MPTPPVNMRSDVIIVGAGVMGSALARRLSAGGLKVLVCAWEAPGHDATWAAAGMLCAQVEEDRRGPLLDLLLAAEDRWAQMGEGFDYQRRGVLRVALDEKERAELLRQKRRQEKRGLPVQFLEPEDVRHLEPGLTHDLTGANFFPRGGQVDNRALVPAFMAEARKRGAELLKGLVTDVEVQGGRVRGVRVAGQRLEADTIVVATGAWTERIRGLRGVSGIPSTVPVRGQLVAFPALPPPVSRPVYGAGGYVLPKYRKFLIAGTTVERVGFAPRVTLAARRLLTARARRLCPSLEKVAVADAWAGLRPSTGSGPLFGPTSVTGLHVAVGLFRNGILLAPLVADLVARAIEGDREAIPRAFRASRLFG